MIIKVKLSDTNTPDWMILPESNTQGGGPCYIAGVNAFVFVPDEDYPDTVFNVPAQVVGMPDGVPGNATQLVGNEIANAWGLPLRPQHGKNSVEENEN